MKNYVLLSIVLFSYPRLLSAQIPNQGPFSPGTATNVAISGSYASWININNVLASDNAYASYGTFSGSVLRYTDYLQATNFGFTIDPSFTILGILVEIERSDPGNTSSDYSVRIVKNGVIVGSDLAANATYTLSDNTQSYGGLGELWGESWTPSDVNSSDFGVAISVKKQGTLPTFSRGRIDNIRIQVLFDNNALPLRLISFLGQANNNGVNLSWTTEEESEMSYFQIEKSTDLTSFKPVYQMKPANRSGRNNYAFNDPKPGTGTVYYRLKLMEENGIFSYSKVVAIKLSEKNKNIISPTIISNHGLVNVSNPEKEKLLIRFYNQSGLLIGRSVTNSSSAKIELAEGSSGIIYYFIENTTNGNQTTGKLMIR